MGFGIGIGPSWARVWEPGRARGVGMSAGPRIARMHASNRGMGVSTGFGPFSAWTGARYPRLNRITVGGSGGPRYLTERVNDPHAVEMASVAGLDALALAPTGSDDLVNQLNAADKFPKWTLLASLSVLLLIVGVSNLGNGAVATGVTTLLLAALASSLAVVVYRKESIEHLVPVEYTLEGQIPTLGRKDGENVACCANSAAPGGSSSRSAANPAPAQDERGRLSSDQTRWRVIEYGPSQGAGRQHHGAFREQWEYHALLPARQDPRSHRSEVE